MWIRSATIKINKNLQNINKTVLKIAEKNVYTIMPGFTHLKNAQAVSFAHYLMAYVEMFNRDKKRFMNNLENLSENPLGVAALTGTSFNIDRNYTTKKLGFKKPTNNSIDTVADRDFVLDFLYSVSVCSLHISRIAEEFIIWNSDGFNLINLSDKVVTGSSIMPQKKNPDMLEYLRGKSGTSFGNLFSMLTILKGLPLSYFKDLQDDKEIVFKSNEIINNCLEILDEILNNFKPNKQKMLELANTGYIVATDFADYLVNNNKMSFRKAYQITALIVNYAEKNKKKLHELKINELKRLEPKIKNDALKVFDLKYSINSKKSYGGTSFDNIKKMITKYKKDYK
jgi:argininosuccinate lyase